MARCRNCGGEAKLQEQLRLDGGTDLVSNTRCRAVPGQYCIPLPPVIAAVKQMTATRMAIDLADANRRRRNGFARGKR